MTTVINHPSRTAREAAAEIRDALRDMRTRCAILETELQAGRMLSSATCEALDGIDKQSDRAALAVLDLRAAQKRAAGVMA
ncbi:hypothetical protein Q4494_13255 [Celeribacter halophilus]|uniref:Uncharacterized protein n=1 Tax=Celeribacter halophilus TaxID=576117 RepID=A0AAW7XUF8_9RHOB|nr:hypothetical protein [Celeribacter halophilus]MDO6455475.1 hypothetical protein [Celeribacter halophilus]MDO6458051.1 hypothetical protein [Celeribacter halophilus]